MEAPLHRSDPKRASACAAECADRRKGQPMQADPRILRLIAGLALGLATRHFLHLLLVGAARSGPLGLWGGLLAGGALHLLAFLPVFNLFRICHAEPLSLQCLQCVPALG